MKQYFRLAAASAVCVLGCSGCGLVFIPYRVRFPDPIQRIEVLDLEKREAIDGAQATFAILKYGNWTHFPPMARVSPSSHTYRLAEDLLCYLDLQREESGEFVPVERRKFVAWLQIYFPIPNPLGWTLYSNYQGLVCAQAPDHHTVCLTYEPEVSMKPRIAGPDQGMPRYEFVPPGTLRFLLPRKEAPAKVVPEQAVRPDGQTSRRTSKQGRKAFWTQSRSK